MDKGSIIERSISDYSEENITWIDGVGKDLYDNEFKLYIEVKYEENCLYTLKRKDPKKFISVKIRNSHGEEKSNDLKNPAHYDIIIQLGAVGIISYEDLKPYLRNTKDGIQAKIPFGKMTIKKIFNHPIEIPDDENYKVLKDKAMDSYMKNISNLVDKSRIKLTTSYDVSTEDKDKKIKRLKDELVILEEENRKKEEENRKKEEELRKEISKLET